MEHMNSLQEREVTGSGLHALKRRIKAKWTSLVFVLIVLALIMIGPVLPPGIMSLMLEMMILSIFAMGYDICLGYTDQCSLGHSLFFGIGAYGIVLPVLHLNVGLWLAVLIALALTFAFAFLEGLISVRLSEAYFVIITAIFFFIFFLLALSMTWLTGGDDGLSVQIPPVDLGFATFSIYNRLVNFYFVLFFLVVTYIILTRIVNSPLGRVFISIRENQERARFLGYNVFRYKLAAFVLSALFAGLSGALYAIRLRYGNADFFSFTWSVNPIVWSLLGGMGTLIGPCIGVVIMSLFQYYVSAWWSQYLIIVGILIIIVLRVSPKGIVGYIKSKSEEALGGEG
ncbi:MAG: branched-chain amino acid ABC transporter permease [Deltaproteobacteria bacterium]|nr:branched-chain amino acid ABC transporter permease [Deltaproteobacteria bacterium]